MIQPITQNFSIPNNRRLTFRNSTSGRVPQQEQTVLENYFDTLVKEKKEQNDMIKRFALGFGCLATAATAMAFTLPFFIKPSLSKSKDVQKKAMQNSETLKSFISLASDTKIPTLDNCKSINDDLKTILKQQIMQLGANQDVVKIAGMPEITNRLILFGPPGSGKSFFAKIMAKSMNAKYMEVQYSDFNSEWAGKGTQNLKNIFEKIIQEANEAPQEKFVVAFNEIDTIVQPVEKITSPSGGTYFMTKLEHRSTFLNYIDELKAKNPNVIVIGTSNLSPKNQGLDGAAMSRFQNIINVSLPNKNCLLEATKWSLEGIKGYNDFIAQNEQNLAELAKNMENRKFSFRDQTNLVASSKKYYLEDLLKDKNKDFGFEYLKKAMETKSLTDGELIKKN